MEQNNRLVKDELDKYFSKISEMNDHIASLHVENQSFSRDLMEANLRERELKSQIEKSDADVAELQELIEATQKAISDQTECDRVKIATLELKLESER